MYRIYANCLYMSFHVKPIGLLGISDYMSAQMYQVNNMDLKNIKKCDVIRDGR